MIRAVDTTPASSGTVARLELARARRAVHDAYEALIAPQDIELDYSDILALTPLQFQLQISVEMIDGLAEMHELAAEARERQEIRDQIRRAA